MLGICATINRRIMTLDTLLSGSHHGSCGSHCIDSVNKNTYYYSHSRNMPTPVTKLGIFGRAGTAIKVVGWNAGAIIGNTLRMAICFIIAIVTSYKLFSASSRKDNCDAWKACVRQLKYMARNVYYAVKYALLGLTPLTLGVKLYQHCKGIKVE